MTYKEIIDKNIKEFEKWSIPAQECIDYLPCDYCTICGVRPKEIYKWYNETFISYLEEENKRIEEEIEHLTKINKHTFHTYDIANMEGLISSKKQQVEHNKNVIAYIKGL